MGLLLGGSILTVFELLDVILYNAAWKTGHRVANAGKLDRKKRFARDAEKETKSPPSESNFVSISNDVQSHGTDGARQERERNSIPYL